MAAANLAKGATSLFSCYSRTTTIRSCTPGHFISFLSSNPPSISLSSTSSLRFSTCNSYGKSRIRSFCTVGDAAAVTDSSSLQPPSSSPVDSSPSSPSTESASTPDPNAIKDAAKLLDIRVGRILKAWTHPEAHSLYVEEVDVGEPEPRTICSGLVKYIPLDNLQGKMVVVLANLKPRNMRGIKSNGMLMAASDAPHENVELILPAEGSLPGERIWFGLEDEKDDQCDPASPNQIQKKKIWESIQPYLKTDKSCTAILLGEHVMRTSAGPVISSSLKNANIA